MARKNTGNGSTSRAKKAVASIQPYPVQVVSDDRKLNTVNLDEEIRRRAYEIYLERQGAEGDERQDWLVAEREIRARHQQEYAS